MAKIKVSSPNLNKVTGGLKALVTGIQIAANQSAKKIAERVFELSDTVPPVVPVDTEKLRLSGRVEPVKEGYAIVYGNNEVDYAAYVHDDLRPRNYKRAGSGPKFVETHALRQAEEAPPKIAAALQKTADEIIRVYR